MVTLRKLLSIVYSLNKELEKRTSDLGPDLLFIFHAIIVIGKLNGLNVMATKR
jgi:hypothetical protein